MTARDPDAHEPVFNVPRVVLAIVASIVLIEALKSFLPQEFSKWLLLYFAFSPARFWAPDLVFGLAPGMAKLSGVWTLFTHFFVHADWGHVTFNSLWILALGSVVARRVGTLRFFLFTFFCAAAGALFQGVLQFSSYTLLIGASGAASGYLAGVLRLVYSTPGGFAGVMNRDFSQVAVIGLKQFLLQNRARVFVIAWLVLNIVSAYVLADVVALGGRISWEAHTGGFLAGLLAFSVFVPRQPRDGGGLN